MTKESHNRPVKNCPINAQHLDITTSMGVAVRNTLRWGSRELPGFIERVAEQLGIEKWGVYKLLERPDQKTTDLHFDAIIDCGGGDMLEAYVRDRNLRAKAVADAECGKRLIDNLRAHAAAASENMHLGIESFLNDGRIDRAEAQAMLKAMEVNRAKENQIKAQLEKIAHGEVIEIDAV